jgi:uncharacterized protein
MNDSANKLTSQKPLYRQDVHVFSKNGKYFAYLTRQMVALLIDNIAFDILGQSNPITLSGSYKHFSGKYSKESLLEVIGKLCDWQILDDKQPHPRPALESDEYSQELSKTTPSEVWLSLANDCNLRCKYCSAGYGRFGQARGLMTKETAAHAIDLLFSGKLAKQESTFVNVIFVGGEPLLNYDVMAFSVEYAKEKAKAEKKSVRFHLNTNGTLLNKRFQKLFLANEFEVVFSIDGTAKNHDSARPYIDNKGSYNDIINNFSRFRKASPKSMRAQSVLMQSNSLRETMLHLLELGFDEVIPNPDYSSRLTGYNSSFNATLMEQFAREYDEWTIENIDRILTSGKLHGNVHLIEDMRTLHKRKPARSSCGAGRSLAISAHGDIFPCQTLIETQEFKLGNVIEGIDQKKREILIKHTEELGAKCRGCWIEGACARPCFQEAYTSGFLDAKEPTQRCALYRSYFESAIYGYYLLESVGKDDLL